MWESKAFEKLKCFFFTNDNNYCQLLSLTYFLLTQFEVRTVTYGPCVLYSDFRPSWELRGPYIQAEKTRFRN